MYERLKRSGRVEVRAAKVRLVAWKPRWGAWVYTETI